MAHPGAREVQVVADEILVVVTGANSAVGRAVVKAPGREMPVKYRIVAAVRSERAAAAVPPIPEGRGRIVRVDYDAPETLRDALLGASAILHLPGLLVERPNASYEDAHIRTTEVAIDAARRADVAKFVLMSAVGADPASGNRYFRSKGKAEELVANSGLSYTILRPPLILGPGTEGSAALRRSGRGVLVPLLRGGRVLHQPLDVDDLAAAALRATRPELARNRCVELAGPERLSYRALVERGAERRLPVLPIPVAPLRGLLALRQRFLGPGFSPDALEVLTTDTRVDAEAAATALGIELTPLDTTLAKTRSPQHE